MCERQKSGEIFLFFFLLVFEWGQKLKPPPPRPCFIGARKMHASCARGETLGNLIFFVAWFLRGDKHPGHASQAMKEVAAKSVRSPGDACRPALVARTGIDRARGHRRLQGKTLEVVSFVACFFA